MSDVSDSKSNLHHIKMTQSPVESLVVKLAIPAIISMLISSIYNTADTFFVSQLGTSATGAVSVVFPLMGLIQSVGFMLGMGSGNLVSRYLGAKQYDEASKIASTGFACAFAFGGIFALLGMVFTEIIVTLLGATQTIQPLAEEYTFYLMIAAPFMCASFVMNNILRGQGKATLSMIGITFGGVLNIILDPIFIFTLNLGVAGAAIATAISQFISFSILLYMFISNRSEAKLHLKYVTVKSQITIDILQTGLPSFFRQSSASVAVTAINWQARIYGDAALAAMGVNSRIFFLLNSVLLGLGQGLQPVVGFNYGARLFERVKKTLSFTTKLGAICATTVGLVGFIFAEEIIGVFSTTDPEVVVIGALAFRAQCFVLPLQALILPLIMALQCTGQTRAASFLSSCRQFICFMPIIFILPPIIGLLGVQIAQPISDIVTTAFCVPYFIAFMKKLTELESLQKNALNKM